MIYFILMKKVSIKVSEDILPFVKPGDELTVSHNNAEKIREITKIE